MRWSDVPIDRINDLISHLKRIRDVKRTNNSRGDSWRQFQAPRLPIQDYPLLNYSSSEYEPESTDSDPIPVPKKIRVDASTLKQEKSSSDDESENKQTSEISDDASNILFLMTERPQSSEHTQPDTEDSQQRTTKVVEVEIHNNIDME